MGRGKRVTVRKRGSRKWLLVALLLAIGAAMHERLTGPVTGPDPGRFEITTTELRAYKRSPAWVDDTTIAYADEAMSLVTYDLETGLTKHLALNTGSLCRDFEGKVRSMIRDDEDAGAPVEYIELDASGLHRRPGSELEAAREYLNTVSCRIVRRDGKPHLAVPLEGPGRLWVTNSIVRDPPGPKEIIRESDRQQVTDITIKGRIRTVQYLPWMKKTDIYVSTGRFQMGDEQFYRYRLDPDRMTVSYEDLSIPAYANSQSHYTVRDGIAVHAQEFDRNGNPQIAGLFLFDETSQELVLVLEGEMPMPAVSPDGCKLATVQRSKRWQGRGERPPYTLSVADICK